MRLQIADWQVRRYAGTLGRWDAGALGRWDAGTLVRYSPKAMSVLFEVVVGSGFRKHKSHGTGRDHRRQRQSRASQPRCGSGGRGTSLGPPLVSAYGALVPHFFQRRPSPACLVMSSARACLARTSNTNADTTPPTPPTSLVVVAFPIRLAVLELPAYESRDISRNALWRTYRRLARYLHHLIKAQSQKLALAGQCNPQPRHPHLRHVITRPIAPPVSVWKLKQTTVLCIAACQPQVSPAQLGLAYRHQHTSELHIA